MALVPLGPVTNRAQKCPVDQGDLIIVFCPVIVEDRSGAVREIPAAVNVCIKCWNAYREVPDEPQPEKRVVIVGSTN